jgi:phenylpropionate dioxygenase-like ring-hydroxylating dioxygenase large terminal subunit
MGELVKNKQEPEEKPVRKYLDGGRRDWATWPRYEAAVTGLRNYWYPVMWARDLGKKPAEVVLLGERIAVGRSNGVPWALQDRCPHRGVPLHLGTTEFPGTISCPYHGWTFDVSDGRLCAALTDGPDSPIVGKVRVLTYPVEERLGLIWIYVGDPAKADLPAPPLDDDLPEELVKFRPTVAGRIKSNRGGNWRYAAENGFDEGHAKYLHRTALWAFFRQLPVWNETRVERTPDQKWVYRRQLKTHWEGDFPGLGRWSQRRWWKVARTVAKPEQARRTDPVIAEIQLPAKASLRLPGITRIAYPRYIHYEWAVPETADSHRYVQIMACFARSPITRLWFQLKYWTVIRWVFHGQFTGQDSWMIDVMDVPPERLYRPDASVTEWRRLVEDTAR